MSRDDLEFELLEHFDAERLSVYADFLQAEGDPRGELIALDLAEHDDPVRHKLLVAAWLGDAIATLLGPDAISVGFVDGLELDGDHAQAGARLSAILASRAAPYIRSLTICGTRAWIARALAALGEHRHVWLDQLSIQLREGSEPSAPATPVLAAFAPNLVHLEVWGRSVLGDITHPTIRSIAITYATAITSLVGTGAPLLPKLALLDLAFHTGVAAAERFCAERLPSVRRIDLSRNEPGTTLPHYLGGMEDAYDFLARLGIRDQLVHVRMPSLRTRAQAAGLATTIAAMPYLHELEIVRNYRDLPYVRVPERVRMPEPWPWLPADRTTNPVSIRLRRTRESANAPVTAFVVDPRELVIWLETSVDDLDPSIIATWSQILALGRSIRFALPELTAALEAIEDFMPSWGPVRTALREIPRELDHVYVDAW